MKKFIFEDELALRATLVHKEMKEKFIQQCVENEEVVIQVGKKYYELGEKNDKS